MEVRIRTRRERGRGGESDNEDKEKRMRRRKATRLPNRAVSPVRRTVVAVAVVLGGSLSTLEARTDLQTYRTGSTESTAVLQAATHVAFSSKRTLRIPRIPNTVFFHR